MELAQQIGEKLSFNELVEMSKNGEENKLQKEHKEMRRRKYKCHEQEPKVRYGKLPIDERNKIEELVLNHREIFSTGPIDLGLINNFQFAINRNNESDSSYIPPRPIPPGHRKGADKVMNEWLEMGVMEPTTSRNNIPLFFRTKSNAADIRPILDCREVNAKKKRDRYPLPSMQALLSEVGERISGRKPENVYITTLDVNNAYPQLRIKKDDRHKVAFSYRNIHYEACRMLFGLSNAPAAWSRLMNHLIQGLPGVYCLLDDIICVSGSLSEHLATLKELFVPIAGLGMTLKPSKCNFGIESTQ